MHSGGAPRRTARRSAGRGGKLGRAGAIDVRTLLTVLVVAAVTLGAGFAIGMWLGS